MGSKATHLPSIFTLSYDEFAYDVKGFIKQVKDDVGLSRKVRVFPIRNSPLAKSRSNTDVPEIELPTTRAISEKMGISQEHAVARSKIAVIEEVCHVHHDQDHTPQVFQCVKTRMDKFLSPAERSLIEAKMERFKKEACQHCGKEIQDPASEAFCSSACAEAAYSSLTETVKPLPINRTASSSAASSSQ